MYRSSRNGHWGTLRRVGCSLLLTSSLSLHNVDLVFSQLRSLEPLLKSDQNPHPSLPLLRDVLTEFRGDELEHLDTAVEEGAQKAPGHSLLSAVIGLGCKAAIKVCERV